jgi:DNA mismatch repair protein MutL
VLEYYDKNQDFSENVRENVALAMAKSAAIDYGRVLEIEEMRELVDKLFACSSPNFTPDGQKIISLMKTEDIEKMF